MFSLNARAAGLILSVAAAGCGNDPAGPDPASELLVANLRALGVEAETQGHQSLADALGAAAGALSNGVAPTSVSLVLDGTPAGFDALVVGTIQQTTFGTLTFRSLVAWRGSSVLEQVLYLSLAADAAPIGSSQPDPDPRNTGSAVLMNAKSGQRWLGVEGSGSIKVNGFGADCPWPFAQAFPCRMAAFLTEAQAELVPTPSGTGTRSVALGPLSVTGFVYGASQ